MSDITDLKAEVLLLYKENSELREQIETLAMYVESDGTRYWVDDDGNQHFDHSAVKDDASELRELVRTLYMCSQARCDQCEYEMHGNTCVFDAEYKIRKLGVEA